MQSYLAPPSVSRHRSRLRCTAIACSIGIGSVLATILPAWGANRVSAIFGPLEISIPVKDIETFAKTGAISAEFKSYAQLLTPQQQTEVRRILQEKLEANTLALERFSGTPMGQSLLKRMGTILQTDPGQEGGTLLRNGILAASRDRQGLTILTLLRRFPVDNLRIKIQPLLQAQKELTALLNYRDSALRTISQEMIAEKAATPAIPFAQWPDLRKPGAFRFERKTLDLSNTRDRQSLLGRKMGSTFETDVYLPIGLPRPAPLVIISHGLGSERTDFSYLAEHLASYGLAVAVPQHIGSDANRIQAILSGQTQGDINPVEFIDRPLDIKYLLDELTRLSNTDPAIKGHLNLQQVGIIGHSLGGYTSLALAGAEINHTRLQEQCSDTEPTFNLSLFLQCRAKVLPPFNYNLTDPRIKAAIAINPLASTIFGPEGLGDIRIPTLIVSGSNDIVAPAIPEQIHPFLWLNSPEKYLAILKPAGHTFAVNSVQKNRESASNSVKGLDSLLSGPEPALSRDYLKAMSVAFAETYLDKRADFKGYLSAAYAAYLSRQPVQLQLVRSLSPQQLEKDYGGPLPMPIAPPLATAVIPPRSESVLATIRKTGRLTAGMRELAPPFAMISQERGQADGYCFDLLNLMEQQLQTQLNTPIKLKLLTSTLTNRFSMVQDNSAQVECGPNTITANPAKGIVFSTPFFITGTHFLVKTANQSRVNPQTALTNITLGVYQQTTTATFLEQKYPAAKKIYFKSDQARTEGIQALTSGKVDALAGDGILLATTLKQQNLSPKQYTLIPERPLTCDAYGLVLPAGDRAWESTVNGILGSEAARQIWDKWFKQLYPYIYLNIDYCADSEGISQSPVNSTGFPPSR
ncbi:MAG: alpha/beta hydrolase [Thermosynechococcaceae cyanobacterium]